MIRLISQSHGTRLIGSTISTEHSALICSAAIRASSTQLPHATTVTSFPGRTMRPRPNPTDRAATDSWRTRMMCLGMSNNVGSVFMKRSPKNSRQVFRRARDCNTQPWDVCPKRLIRLAMPRPTGGQICPAGRVENRRAGPIAIRPPSQCRNLIYELVESRNSEVDKLQFENGAIPRHCKTDSSADDRRFSQWRIYYPSRMARRESFGKSKHPSFGIFNVFPKQDRRRHPV